MTGSDIHASHSEWVNRAKAANTRISLDLEFARLGETGFSQTGLYTRLVTDAGQSLNAYVKDALHDHLRGRDDFSPKMPTADFIKKADWVGFETIGLFKSIVEGHVLVLARAADAQIMLANTRDQVVIGVELHRFRINEGSAPTFSAEFFGEDHYLRINGGLTMVSVTTPVLLGAMLEHDLNSRRLATDWRASPLLTHRGLLMGVEASRLGKGNLAGAASVRAAAIVGGWRDIFALDQDDVSPAEHHS